jgi:hypothetical protein
LPNQDRLVKERGKWLFDHRRVDTDRLVTDPQKPINLADPDVAVLVRHLIDAAQRLARKTTT